MPDRHRIPAHLVALALGAGAAIAPLGVACTSSAPSPFAPDAGGGGDAGEDGAADAGPDADPTLGGPCVDDGQCDDGVPCTFDACDHDVDRCRFTPDDSVCQNELYCDGIELCDQKLGCRAGEPIGCGDESSCTIDGCDEATDTCTHGPRDADLDGDPDVHCGGTDCDDQNPAVAGAQPEVCANNVDDNCDQVVDEAACVSPEHDTCSDPLLIDTPGSYAMTTAGAAFHYASSCSLPSPATQRDVVAAVVLAPGPPIDVEVTARSPAAEIAVTLAGQCGDPASEIACGGPFPSPQGGLLAKLRGRSLGAPGQSTALPLYVTTSQGTPVTVDVAFLPPTPAPTNETCGTATPLTPGVPAEAAILDAALDLGSACATGLGDLVYAFDLAAPADVDLYATSLDGDGLPMVSLRTAACALPEDEITCQSAPNVHILRHALPAGTYYAAVSASAPTAVLLTVELSAPTPPPPDDDCATAPPLTPNQTSSVSLANHQDDISLGCLAGAVDAAYTLDLPVASDVLLVQRISQGDTGAVSLVAPACADPADQLACGAAATSPIRAARHNLAAGEYRVVAETQLGQPIQLTAFTRPAVAPTLIPFADGCADVFEIPPTGGLFQGNTTNASADLNAGCDQGGTPQGGAPDQLLKLTLSAPKRVVLDMAGSGYATLLDVRKGPTCPGAEVALACTVGSNPMRSFLDLSLDPGVYFLQIDGLALDHGPWFLDVRVVDP